MFNTIIKRIKESTGQMQHRMIEITQTEKQGKTGKKWWKNENFMTSESWKKDEKERRIKKY